MTAAKILLIGYGDIASRFLTKHPSWSMVAISRTAKTLPVNARHWCGAINDAHIRQKLSGERFDIAIITLTPDGRREADYRTAYFENVRQLLHIWRQPALAPKQVIYVSSSGVYPQVGESWLDESSPAEPTNGTPKVLRDTEKLLQQSPMSSCVVRFSGIYGPGRNYLINQVKEGIAGEQVFTNRIHIDDCVGVISLLCERALSEQTLPPLLLATDDEPAVARDVRQWVAARLGFPKEHLQGPQNSLKRAIGKRLSNAALKALGYTFIYPSYREGYAALLSVEKSPVDE